MKKGRSSVFSLLEEILTRFIFLSGEHLATSRHIVAGTSAQRSLDHVRFQDANGHVSTKEAG